MNVFNAAVPATSHVSGPTNLGGAEMDLLGSLSDSFPTNSLALVPAASAAFETDASGMSSSGPTFASSVPANQVGLVVFLFLKFV